MPERNGNIPMREQPATELLKQLSEQATALARKEIELAKVELAVKGKRAAAGAGMLGAGALLAVLAAGSLTACLILALATVMAGWLAALVVFVVFATVAGALALTGKGKLAKATPPVPEQATRSVKEDVQWAKMRLRAARQ